MFSTGISKDGDGVSALILSPRPLTGESNSAGSIQAADRADLREKLRVAGGGVVFTTIQKFMPAEQGDRNAVLSDRRNIVVIADEAHRSQYDFIDGFARHMLTCVPAEGQPGSGDRERSSGHCQSARSRIRIETLCARASVRQTTT
jgi:hypothetical protein